MSERLDRWLCSFGFHRWVTYTGRVIYCSRCKVRAR